MIDNEKSIAVTQDESSRDKELAKAGLYGLTFKALLIGIGAILFLTWLDVKANLYKQGVSFDLISAPSIGAIFIILALMLFNLIFRRLLRKSFIAEHELIIIYIMTSFAGIIVVYPYYLNSLFPRLIAYAQMTLMFSSRYPQVAGRMSSLLVPVDINTVNSFLRGGSQVPWNLWITPMLMWFLFFSAFFLLQLSIATMIRRRWTDIEHLSYPLTMPIYSMMAEEEGKGYIFWKDRLVWLGAIIPIMIFSLTSLHRYFPVLPEVNLTYNLKQYFTDEPWKTVAETTLIALEFNPLYIGIAYLLPLDLLFSFWFFRLVHYMRFAIQASLLPFDVFFNWTGQPSEFIAGLSVVALMLLWTARGDLAYIIKRGVSKYRDPNFDESNEPLSYKTTFWLFVICFAFLAYFYGVLMDGSVWYSIIVLLSFCGTAFAWARVRAEAGLPQTQAGTWFNTVAVAQSTGRYYESILLAGLGHEVVDYGAVGCQTGVALEAYKLGDKSGVSRKSVTLAMIIAFVVAVATFFPLALKAYYTKGAYVINRGLVGSSWYHYYQGYVTDRGSAPNPASYVMGAISFVITLILYVLRLRFVWWPFHPFGFALTKYVYGPRNLWFPFFVAWVIKFYIYRWAGRDAFNTTRRIAMGLIAGTVVTQAFWALIGLII